MTAAWWSATAAIAARTTRSSWPPGWPLAYTLPLHVVHGIAVEDCPVEPDWWTDEADARSLAKQQQVVEGLLAGHEGPWDRRGVVIPQRCSRASRTRWGRRF